ncbi:hypothetical protein [Persephonella sp. KM09-Lau-8]|uniref:hypothetical protein n=1 Tax=Persephonella sp. KM09-Lau-8 TaxID=1158345 RepID=UPI000494DFC9|nr:hypothetical protein [Persephonella sp. KM09-Lau-8]
MDEAGKLRLHQGTPESVLSQVGDLHSTDILILLILILVAGIGSYVIMVMKNNKKPPEERRSNFVLFLIALNVGFFTVVLFFVYRVVFIGLKYLMSQ